MQTTFDTLNTYVLGFFLIFRIISIFLLIQIILTGFLEGFLVRLKMFIYQMNHLSWLCFFLQWHFFAAVHAYIISYISNRSHTSRLWNCRTLHKKCLNQQDREGAVSAMTPCDYSRLRNKRRGTLIIFWAFFQWLRAY